MSIPNELNPPIRFLMGPGPSDVHPRVSRFTSSQFKLSNSFLRSPQ